MNKTIKKVLSVVLALAMVVTSITVTNTAKADVVEMIVTAANENDTRRGIEASWTNPEGTAYVKVYLNEEGQVAQADNGHVWTGGEAYAGTNVDHVHTVQGNSDVHIDNGGDFVIIVVAYNEAGEEIGRGTSNVVTLEEFVILNTDLNLRVERYGDAIAYLKWDLVGGATKYEVWNADTNTLMETQNNAATDWLGVNIEMGVNYNLIVKPIDADGNVIEVTNNTTQAYQANFDLGLGVAYGTNVATLSWKAITGATKYVIYNGETEVTTLDATALSYDLAVETGVVYEIVVKAYDAQDAEIQITNNTKSVEYVAEGAPSDNDISKVDTSSWTALSVKSGEVENSYFINSAHGLSTGVWWGIYAPHSSAAYHNERTKCVLGDAAGFVFQQRNVKEIWVNQNKYGNPSTAFNNQGDCAEISVDVLTKAQNVVTLVLNDGSMITFAIKVDMPLQPDATAPATQETIDPSTITDWVELAGPSETGSKAYISQASADKMGNGSLRGFYGAGKSTNWNISDKMKAVPVFGFVANNANASSVIIDGVEYINSKDKNNEKVFVGSDCVYINQNVVEAAAGETKYYTITAVGSAVGTFVLKVVGPELEQPEVEPDQTLTEVTDWVMVGNNASVDGNNYYVSEAFRNTYINHVDLFGLYAEHTTTPYHPANCTLTGAVYVSSYPSVNGKIKSVWIDGVKYESGTEVCYIDGDQVHLAQSLFSETKTYAITVRADETDLTYALKVEEVVKYSVTVDGTEIAAVEAGETITLPTDATYGYYIDGAMYKAGATVIVNADMAFTSVNELSVAVANGAGIKVDSAETAGIRFQARVASDNMDAVASDAIAEGMLITANDIFENKGSVMDITSTYTLKNIVNSGWYNGTVGTYCGSIVKIVTSNYIRPFIARAYVTVNYVDGESVTVYSGMSSVRSIAQVADNLIAAGALGQFTSQQQAAINAFAAAND